MPQMSNPFLPVTDLLPNTQAGAGNIITGGQLGFGNNLPNIDAATPLVLRPIVPIITHAPTMFQYLPGMTDILKALLENHARSIDGIDLQYTIDPGATPAGQDGQELNVPTNAKRAQVNPQFTLPEINGNLVWNFFRLWMRLMKDPDTQAASLAGVIPGSQILRPHVLSMFTMDMLFIQYDTTLRPENIIDGYFITSMWPNDTGVAGFKKQIAQSDVVERTIPFHGVLQHNDNTRAVAQQIASLLRLHTIDYNFSTPIATQVESNILEAGLQLAADADLANFGQV